MRKVRVRTEIHWFWLAYGITFSTWGVVDALNGKHGFWNWFGIAFMTGVVLVSIFEIGELSPKATGSPTEFAGKDFDFAVGEVYGLRAWKLDSRGRLGALHVKEARPWRPGVNVATCHVEPLRAALRSFARTKTTLTATGFTVYVDADEHKVPVEDCGCGFYAYTDLGHRENRANGRNKWVLGVVRGTGRTLIGTKGFRTEKAEVVALLDPTRGGRLLTAWRRRQRRLLREVYPEVPLLPSRRRLVDAFPIERYAPTPSDDAFWSQP